MRRFLILVFLSCVAIPSARADVIALDGAVVLNNGRQSNDGDTLNTTARDNGYNYGRAFSGRNNDVLIYNGNNTANGGDAFIIQDGRFVRAQDGSYDLDNGNNINVDQGRVNGTVGGVEIKN